MHEGTTQSLAFTPDFQYLVSACSLEVLNVWSIHEILDTTRDGEIAPLCSVDNAHDLGILCIDISNAVTMDGRCIRFLYCTKKFFQCICPLIDEDPLVRYYLMATSGNSNEIKTWTISSRSRPKHDNTQNVLSVMIKDTYDGHFSAVTCVRFNTIGNLLISSSLDKFVKIWNDDGSCLATLEGHTRYVNCVAFSRDTLLAASGIYIVHFTVAFVIRGKVQQVRMIKLYLCGTFLVH